MACSTGASIKILHKGICQEGDRIENRILTKKKIRKCQKVTECKIGFIPKLRKCQNRHFSSVCPEKEPMIGEPCSLPSDVGPCSYGSECCCGECHPRSILDKSLCLRMLSFFLISNCQEAYFQLMLLLSEKLKVPIRRKLILNLKHLPQQLESRMHRG